MELDYDDIFDFCRKGRKKRQNQNGKKSFAVRYKSSYKRKRKSAVHPGKTFDELWRKWEKETVK